MKKIEAIIKPAKFDDVKDSLAEVGIDAMSVTEVRGVAWEASEKVSCPSIYPVDLMPRLKIEIAVSDEKIDNAIAAICNAMRPFKSDVGIIVVVSLDQVVRIRA